MKKFISRGGGIFLVGLKGHTKKSHKEESITSISDSPQTPRPSSLACLSSTKLINTHATLLPYIHTHTEREIDRHKAVRTWSLHHHPPKVGGRMAWFDRYV
jgi:hypothetical protein